MIAALLLSAGGVAGSTNIDPSQLPRLFISACLDGEARLSPGDASAMSFNQLPRELQERLRAPASSHIWRLNVPGNSFLYILNYPAGPDTSPKICGLASDQLDYAAATDAVQVRVTGEDYPKTSGSLQWTDPKAGYVAITTQADGFKVLQINWLSEQQRARAISKYRQVTP
jgi:hypothetical protein